LISAAFDVFFRRATDLHAQTAIIFFIPDLLIFSFRFLRRHLSLSFYLSSFFPVALTYLIIDMYASI